MRKKKLIATILVVTSIAATAFTGCSSDTTANKDKKQIVFFSNKIEAVDTYNKLVEKFEAENPDIDVVVSAPPDATTVLKTRLVKEDAPDIISLSADRSFADFVDANILEDLTDEIDFSVIDPVYNQMLKDLEIESVDGIYGVPYALNASGVVYNKDIFDELGLSIPKTWDEFLELAQTVKDNGITPFYFTLKDTWTSLPAWNNISGALVSTDCFRQVNNKETTFNEVYSETADKVLQLMDYGHSDNFGVGYNDGNTAFAQGKAAMYIIGNYAIPAILTVNPDINLGMFTMPVSNDESENKLISGIDVYFSIPKDSKNKEESIRFINFLLEEENAKTYIEEQSAFSAVKGVKQEDSKFEALEEYFENSRVVDFQDHFYPAELSASDMVQTYLLDENKEKFLNNFQKEWLKANRQYIKK